MLVQMPTFEQGLKHRPSEEFLSAAIYRPLAHRLVLALYRTPADPLHLLALHTVLGFLSAWLMVRGQDLLAAILLQVKSVLDNADGQLARVKGLESELGRYLDTDSDFLVNLALFYALYLRTGEGALAALAFVVLTLVQSWDFNLEHLYRRARGEAFRSQARDKNGFLVKLLRLDYAVIFGLQDKLVRGLEGFLFRVQTASVSPEKRARLAHEWWNLFSTASLVNLGLTTQLFFLGLFLVLHQPRLYLTFVILQGAYLVGVYLWRILRLLAIRSRP